MTLIPILAILLTGAAGSLCAQTYALRAGHVIDPVTAKVHDNQTILVSNGLISEIGSNIAIPAEAELIDLANSWVMPGLMDAHVHLTLNVPAGMGPDVPFEAFYLTESNAFRALRGIRNARLVLEAGFTTVKDIGNDGNYTAIDIRRSIEQGWFPGPTLINTGKIIAAFGGQSGGISPDQDPFWQFEYIDADSPEELRKAVRRNIYYGANAIKLVADNSPFFYSLDEIRAAVEETHRAGYAITVHVQGGEAARNVILGGADGIEHGFELDDELLLLMKKHGTWLIGTDFPLAHLQAMGSFVSNAQDRSERIIKRLRRAHELGVKMAFGTDVVVDLPDKNRGELALDFLDTWQAAGIPAAKTLQCMTSEAARLLRIQDSRGTLASGYHADIVATPSNPLEDIYNLRQIHFVMKNGRIIKQP